MRHRLTAYLPALIIAALASQMGNATAGNFVGLSANEPARAITMVADEKPAAEEPKVIPAKPMFCQISGLGNNTPQYCKVNARNEGEYCVCKRRLAKGQGGATSAIGRVTLNPKGQLW